MISPADLGSLESRVGAALTGLHVELKFSRHFVNQRINDARNIPAITLAELDDLWSRFISQHIVSALTLPNRATFNIRCLRSAINIPCEIRDPGLGARRQIVAITVMRNPAFFTKDRYDFQLR